MTFLAQKPDLNLWIIVSALLLCLLSYNGAPNPYPLGLLSAIMVGAGLALTSLGLSFLFASNQVVFKLLHTALYGLCFIITTVSWFYFDYFQALFTASILAMGMDIFAGTQALDFAAHAGPVTLLGSCLLFGLAPIWLSKKQRRPSPSLLFSILLVFMITLGVSERALSHYRERGVKWLVPANLHPVHAFFSREFNSAVDAAAEKSAFDYFAGIFETNPSLPVSDEFETSQYNVLIVLLESMRADLAGLYGGPSPSLTPNFDALANQGLVARQHYSNTTHTVSAEINIWCGVYDFPGEVKLAYRPESTLNVSCLPQVLRNQGYESYYFHGNTAAFYNRDTLLPKLGFDHLYFYKDQREPQIKARSIGWGVDDVTMFSTMTTRLNSRPADAGPFFAHITTLSNHYPFKWNFSDPEFTPPFSDNIEANSLFQNYQNMIAYTDYALGKFWRQFMRSKYAENTIVVVTSDHGIWQFDDDRAPLMEKNERFFRAPLFIYHPSFDTNMQLRQVSSHLDIPVTLAQLLGVPFDQLWVGRDLLQSDRRAGWAVIGKGSDLIYRSDTEVCFYNSDECSDNQQNCAEPHGEIILLEKPGGYKVCHHIAGDLLADYELNPADELSATRFDQARLMRSFINKNMTLE